ncbi:M20/M25/M40 family metallo-hydrolase, partial [Oceanibaculum pacificum]|uniref:M20/M25/M40 family metallo-hydrolase n=1 Tax=Oceanibaculum pacificum TaxID=580166 RepID=UPI0012EE12C6
CCLNGEPSGVHTIRFGEKGTLRLTFTAKTAGAHGAYPHLSESATKIMAHLAVDLEALEALEPDVPAHIRAALEQPDVIAAFDASLGEGASKVATKVTVNVGVLKGGVKVNVLPDLCEMQVDIRMPVGIDKVRIYAAIEDILKRYPQVTMEEHVYHSYPSSVCDPEGEMVSILRNNVEQLIGIRPPAIVSLGGSDGRYWRWAGVNAYLYGPSPKTMGRRGEHVEIEEFLHIVRTHVLSAYDYLMAG